MPVAPFVTVPYPSFNRRHRWQLPAFLWVVLLSLFVSEPACAAVSLNAEEQKLAQLLTSASGQRRDRSKMVADERLCQVARARAMDMARRRYFAHVNPDGNGPNYLVRQTGYPLPSHYNTSKSGNNIESIGCGYANAGAAWNAWMASSGHKTHLLATESFYRDQTAYGVGYYYDPASPYGRYYVVLTAPPAGDTLTITSPSSGARLASNQVTVTGQVSGSDVVSQLVYRVENASGVGGWQSLPVPSGVTVGNWSTNVSGLALGTNTVRVRSMNNAGALMKEAARSVRLAVLRPLTVELSGDGSVTAGYAGISQREVGQVYTITATPKANALFSHWEGFPASTSRDLLRRTQSFTMAEGLVLKANFIPNPFFTRNGAYEGLILGGTADHATTGMLRLTVARTGGFSGQLILGASRLSVRGTLNSAGTATVTLARTGLPSLVLTLQMDVTNPTQMLSARLSDGTAEWEIQADRRALPTGGSTTLPRRYTFRVAPDTTAPESPQGFGYGAATISASNVATISGKLADGRPLSAKAVLAANGNLAVYAPQFGRAGAFAAGLKISEDGMLSGSGRWLRPERPLDTRYSAAFTTTSEVLGGLYVRPALGTRALAWEPGGNGLLTLSSGDLAENLAQSVVLGTNNLFTWEVPAIPSLRVALNPATGAFSGAFLHPSGARRVFRGITIQQLGGAWGHFLSTTESGAVSLEAAGE